VDGGSRDGPGGLHAPAEAAMIGLVCGFSGLIPMVLGAIKNVAVPGSDNHAPH
jgi:hypothetical protein